MNGIHCYHCNVYGHKKFNCWHKDQQVNHGVKNEEESNLFMAHCDTNKSSDLLLIDTGRSNHTIGAKSMFKDLDETQNIKVELGSCKELQVEGKGTLQSKQAMLK